MTHPLHGKGAHGVLCQRLRLQQRYLDVAVELSVIRPILAALHLDKQQTAQLQRGSHTHMRLIHLNTRQQTSTPSGNKQTN